MVFLYIFWKKIMIPLLIVKYKFFNKPHFKIYHKLFLCTCASINFNICPNAPANCSTE